MSRPRLRRPGWFGVTSTGRTTSPRTARPSAATAALLRGSDRLASGARHTSDTNLAYPTPAFQGGDQVYCHWNRQSGRWEIVSNGTPWFIRYAKVQDGYTNFLLSGFFPYVSNARSVPIKFCDAYGSNEWGIVEDFPLPWLGDTPERPPSVSPALFPGDVIMLGKDCNNQLVIMDFGAHCDAAGGTVRMMATPGIPRGWSVFNPMTDRFPLGAGGIVCPRRPGGGDHRHQSDTTTYKTFKAAADPTREPTP